MAVISKEQIAKFAKIWGGTIEQAEAMIKEQGHTIEGGSKSKPAKADKEDKK